MGFRDEILKRLETDRTLPSLPDVVVQLSRLISKGDASADQIANLVKHDPSLAVRILRLANSAVFGGSVRISSIPQAVARIGLNNIKDMVLSLSLVRLFTKSGHVDFHRFWRHSFSVGLASQIMEQHGKKLPGVNEETFSVGLLHDIGVLMMDQFAGDIYRKAAAFAQSETRELCDVERDILGIDHAEVGACLIQRWNLPKHVQGAVRYHHDPCATEAPSPLSKIVHLANFACNNQGIDNGVGIFPAKFSESAWFDVGLTVEDIPAIIDEVNKQNERAELILDVAED